MEVRVALIALVVFMLWYFLIRAVCSEGYDKPRQVYDLPTIFQREGVGRLRGRVGKPTIVYQV
jgi:hypothetical protein